MKDSQYGERYVNPPNNTTDYSSKLTTDHKEPPPEVHLLPDTTSQTEATICGIRDISIFIF